jgi:hypothetical protein
MLVEEADQVVCLTIPRCPLGVGRWYRDFTPASDQQVLALLAGMPGRTTESSRAGPWSDLPSRGATPSHDRGATPGALP